MTPFNPQDWSRLPDWLDPRQDRRSPREITQEVLERCCMVVAFCLCFAGMAPSDVIPSAFVVSCSWPGSPPLALRPCAATVH